MKKVDVINNKTGQKYGARFLDDPKMNEWIAEQIKLKSWGRPERVYLVKDPSELPADELPIDILKIEPVDTPNGTRDRYTFRADFTLTITDITEENNDNFKLRKSNEARNIGAEILDLIGLYNSKKNRTKAELKNMFKDSKIAFIIVLLQTGAVSIAKDEIMALDTYFTEAEKTNIIQRIDKFLNSFIA